jgi:four helix bundle protein
MTYERFEDLPVWKAAMEIAVVVYRLTRDRFFSQPGDLRDQLRRAALSVSNNIAEGFERGSMAELLAFLYIARGSAGEVRSMLHFAERMPEAAHLKSEISDLKSITENCSRQIRGWAVSLQNSDIRGPRHLNEQTRYRYEAKKRADAFEKQLQAYVRKARPQDYPEEERGEKI